MLTTFLHLASRLRMSGATLSLLLYTVILWTAETVFRKRKKKKKKKKEEEEEEEEVWYKEMELRSELGYAFPKHLFYCLCSFSVIYSPFLQTAASKQKILTSWCSYGCFVASLPVLPTNFNLLPISFNREMRARARTHTHTHIRACKLATLRSRKSAD